MVQKVVAWSCWSNEKSIAEVGQCGVLHGRLFSTREAAEGFYRSRVRYNANEDDPIVRVTVEIVPSNAQLCATTTGGAE